MKNGVLFSIIIPVLNEEKYIRRCLLSLMNSDLPLDDIEIIIVDNGSVDKTRYFARQFKKVTILKKPGVNISALRNHGAEEANGQFFAFLDGDCKVTKNWPKASLEHFKNKDIAIVGADPIVPKNSSWVAQAWAFNFPNSKNFKKVQWVASHNLIVKREVFYEVNGFNENLIVSEDVDFCNRVRQKKYKIISDPRISVYHLKNPKTINDFFWKEIWRGKCTIRLFISNFPKIRGYKSLYYGIWMLLSLFCFFVGIFLFLIKGKIFLFILSSLAVIAGPFYLTASSVIQHRQFKYFFRSFLLFFVYGIARGLASINSKNWSLKN